MLAAADGVIGQLHILRISKCVRWMLRIPVLSDSCQEAVTLVIKPCALIPDSVHMCCTLVPRMPCHPSHGTDCPKKRGKVLRLPLRSYRLNNRISQFRFDTKYKRYTLLQENLRSPSYFGDTYNQSSHTGTGL